MRSYIFDVCSLQIKLIYICTTWHFSIRINNKLAIVFSARSPSKKVLTISICFFTIHKENTKESSHSREGFFTSFQNYSTIFKPFPKHWNIFGFENVFKPFIDGCFYGILCNLTYCHFFRMTNFQTLGTKKLNCFYYYRVPN